MSKQKPWPADRVERRSVKSLMAYPRNARVHSDEQVDQIAASMQEFGWTIPVLVDEAGVLIAGHGRVLAANKLGIENIPVMVASGWSDAQKRAYRLADNQLPMNATWDAGLLRLELNELKLENYDLKLIGFDDLQLVQFMAGGPTGADPEAVPEPPAVPVSKRGDIWLCGDHRVMCGDATSAEDVVRLLDGAKPHLMVTDPPYGIDYDPLWRDAALGPAPDRAVGKVINDNRSDWREAWVLFPGDVAYEWHPPGAKSADHAIALGAAGLECRIQIIWSKQQFVIGRGDYHLQHEPCWYAVRKGRRSHWNGDRTQSTLWNIDKSRKSETGHSTQKPIECMKRPIENNSKPGEAVYDPFLGSGTTMIAAEMTARKCLGLEIDPGYCDCVVRRWQDYAKKEARHAVTSRTHAEEQAARSRTPAKRKGAPRAAAGTKKQGGRIPPASAPELVS